QTSQRKLLAFFDRNGEVDYAFVWICRIVFEGGNGFSGVFDKSLLSVKLLEVFKQALTDFLAIGDVAFVETDYCPDLCLREDGVSFDLKLSQPVNLAFDNRHSHAQTFVNRRQERQRQNPKTGPARSDTLNARLTVSCLQITFRTHVVINQTQVDVEFLAIEDV